MEERELRELTDAAFVIGVRYNAREADKQIVVMMVGKGADPIETIADLLWDHHMGEPEDPTLDQVITGITELRQEQKTQTGWFQD